MTNKRTLLTYRLQQARETLLDAQKMLDLEVMPRSIINRAYYTMFYSVLVLIVHFDITIKTSRHAGVISIFDKDFIRTGKIDKRFSEMLHNAFDGRLEADYGDLVVPTREDALEHLKNAEEFLARIEQMISENK